VIGRTVGNYVVSKKIGEGGMGAVYLAEHPRIHRQVAIKVLLPAYSQNSEVVARFFNEAKAANEIRNEHIIDILDFGELDDGGSYIVMEWLDGQPLTAALGPPMAPRRAVHIARGIGRALAAAHARGIVHRDLKPDNIFLIARNDDPDFVKVLDFGIAKLMSSPSAATPDVKTKTGALIGTPSYMSPEQCRGAPVDHRTDIYALGVLLYQMLTGRLPFIAEGLGELLLLHMTAAPTPPTQLVASIPPVIERAVMRAMEKEADRRFQQVDALLDALQGFATGKHAAAPDATTLPGGGPRGDTLAGAASEAVSPTVNRRGPRALLVGAAAGVVAVGGALIFMQMHKTAAPPRAVFDAPASTPSLPVAPAPAANSATASNAAPAPTKPETSHVTIRIEPAGAEVLLDDARLPLPFDGTFPRSNLRHRLLARAPGYRSEAEWVTFDADRALDLHLQRGAGSHERKPAAPADEHRAAATGARPEPGKPVYKGTKGTLITDYPDQ
jgi:serine/threonine-protein kinase